MKLFLLTIEPVGTDFESLHETLLRHPDIRAVRSFQPGAYWLKSDRTAEQIAALLVRHVKWRFAVAECVPGNITGRFGQDVAWFATNHAPRTENDDGVSRDELPTVLLEEIGRLQAQGIVAALTPANAIAA